MRFVVFLALSASRACAGGFDRFERDETLLFDAAGTVVDVTVGFAPASGHYETVDGRAEHVDIGADTWSGALRIKVTPSTGLSCLASVTEPFGSKLDFGSSWSRADVVTAQRLRVTEFGASCGYAVPTAAGVVMPLAGLAYDHLSFTQERMFTDGVVHQALDLDSSSYSWRAGLGYSHSPSGIQASVVYYSAMSFDVDGNLTLPAPGGRVFGAPIHGQAEFPQSVRADLALSPAPSWLLSLAGQWSDWSRLDHVSLKAASATAFWKQDTELLDLNTHFRAGLTMGVLLGRAWSPEFATWSRLTWDRATTTGWTEHSQSWSWQVGVRYNLSAQVELKSALTAIWLDDAVIDQRASGAPYAATYDGALMFVPHVGITTRF